MNIDAVDILDFLVDIDKKKTVVFFSSVPGH